MLARKPKQFPKIARYAEATKDSDEKRRKWSRAHNDSNVMVHVMVTNHLNTKNAEHPADLYLKVGTLYHHLDVEQALATFKEAISTDGFPL